MSGDAKTSTAVRPRVVAVVPARMGSTRFPGKPLAPLLGKPMVQHVCENASAASLVDGVVLATCDAAIEEAASSFGVRTIMTSAAHERASDRVAEAAAQIEGDLFVMLQGDEPMVTPGMVDEAVQPMLEDRSIGCVNLAAPIRSRDELEDPNTIKVVFDQLGDALYFSRRPIPSQTATVVKAWKQVCVIPFTRDALEMYAQLPPTPAEIAESVDMLRFLEHGMRVRITRTDNATRAVDTQADLDAVMRLMRPDPTRAA